MKLRTGDFYLQRVKTAREYHYRRVQILRQTAWSHGKAFDCRIVEGEDAGHEVNEVPVADLLPDLPLSDARLPKEAQRRYGRTAEEVEAYNKIMTALDPNLRAAIEQRLYELYFHPTAAGVMVNYPVGLIWYDSEGDTVAEFITYVNEPDNSSVVRYARATQLIQAIEAEPINEDGDTVAVRIVGKTMDARTKPQTFTPKMTKTAPDIPPAMTVAELAESLRRTLSPEQVAELKELL